MTYGNQMLRMENIHKSFGATRALRGVSLEVAAGEVHAIVGENGAGKSTLMKILSGAEKSDHGQMFLGGNCFAPNGPQDARRNGVAMIYQELALAPHLDVETNMMLGQEAHRLGFVRSRIHRDRVRQVLRQLAHPEIQPTTPVQRLSPAACQLVEVARALIGQARVIVFDEPTSSLTHQDAEHLFHLIGRLKAHGVSILYISHFLEEVIRIADRYTVLRDGESVASGTVATTAIRTIVQQMVGRGLDQLFPKVPHTLGDIVLKIDNLSTETLPGPINLTLRRREIMGLFGLIGAGRTELMRTLFRLDPCTNGEVYLNGLPCRKRTPAQMIAAGMGFVSEDRKSEGLALTRSIADNVTYSRLAPYLRFGLLAWKKRRTAVTQWLEKISIRYRSIEQRVSELSGGNQQKVALARLLHQESNVLLLDEPTRGVDVGSKTEIYQLIGKLAAAGKSILFVSSYLPELLGVCDTLAVMSRGRLSAVRPVPEWTQEQIMEHAVGGM